ncbi:efflux RND transporter permease subunit [Myxococcota bacterium]|nr:efflux RND transporter permease subunit [Myxococcota bacterium]MBU1379319.1 efflux RND transporter permease subunit [Myxococcota bacterium]MBU1497727.1 efflux RND transporter permease subunit [Myxococcota bacterium]
MSIKGPIGWMAGHRVASNLLMMIIIVGGLLSLRTIKQEVFPDFEIEIVNISVEYPGASPEDVEKSVVTAVENSISGIDGIMEVRSTAVEGGAQIVVEVSTERHVQEVAQDIKSAVDRITTFPAEIEKPRVSAGSHKRPVLALIIFGDADTKSLHNLAEKYRDELIAHEDISVVEIEGIPPLEIAIEVPEKILREYNTTLTQIAARIRSYSKDFPSGAVRTSRGEILLRVSERKDYGKQFELIPVIARPNATPLLLRDIAVIKDSFRETDEYSLMNGKNAVKLEVYREGAQTPLKVASAVRKIRSKMRDSLPTGVKTRILRDRSITYKQRIDLIFNNGIFGLLLVLILLGLFLEPRLAFWVAMGIPVSFMGSFIIMPYIGISINMMSTYAFIIALGIVVDDAIVIGEQIYSYRQAGRNWMDSAVSGARDVALPVVFSVLTNIVTFVPIYFIPGRMGKMFNVIPVIVIMVFLVSLLESLFILPAHLGHRKDKKGNFIVEKVAAFQQKFSEWFQNWIKNVYGSFLLFTLQMRYVMVALAFGLLAMSLAFAGSGRMGFHLFPKIESDFSEGAVMLPFGTPVKKTEEVLRKMLNAAVAEQKKLSDPSVITSITMDIGRGGSHSGRIRVNMSTPKKRAKVISVEEFTKRWRKAVGEVPGVEYLRFSSDSGGPGGRGRALTLELSHRDMEVLKKASKELADIIASYPNSRDVDDGFEEGKVQYNITIRDEAAALGITAAEVGAQLRSSFYGSEVLRQVRGRNEIRVMVRLPEEDREKVDTLEKLMVKLPGGGYIPLIEIAEIRYTRSFTSIVRRNGRRVVQVSADVQPRAKAEEILNDLKSRVMPDFLDKHQQLQYSIEGHRADMRESLESLKKTFPIALMIIYLILAIMFRSYAQPLIVMISIPFGIVGAFLGHYIMGFTLSLPSIFGIVALSGVVINDSLVMIEFANRQRDSGLSHFESAHSAAISRFRAIFLTTVTTFCGLFPMIFETDRSARFLIPMALSLGFGLLFATFITLVIVPALYVAVSDISGFFNWVFHSDDDVDSGAGDSKGSDDDVKNGAVPSPCSTENEKE